MSQKNEPEAKVGVLMERIEESSKNVTEEIILLTLMRWHRELGEIIETIKVKNNEKV